MAAAGGGTYLSAMPGIPIPVTTNSDISPTGLAISSKNHFLFLFVKELYCT